MVTPATPLSAVQSNEYLPTAQPGGGWRALAAQLVRFAVAGIVTVGLDFALYGVLLALGLWVHEAKAIGFATATVVAYLVHRSWTFGSRGGVARATAFAALYSTSFAVNVGVNAVAFHLLAGSPWQVVLAFVIAQGASTTINFLTLRLVIFRH